MREEYERWAGCLAEADDQERWLADFGLWVMAWKEGIEAFREVMLAGFMCDKDREFIKSVEVS